MGAGRAIFQQQEDKKRNDFYKQSTDRMTNMQKQLDELMSMSKKRDELRAQRRASYGAATVGQQMGDGAVGGAGLRISKGGMSPSARRRMHRGG
jgi:hypothetical protein